jgi:hypothetical protein
VLPLFYLHTGPSEFATSVFPLFWYFHTGSSVTHMLLPLYLRAHRDTADTTVVLNVYFKRGRGADEGSWSFHFFPLFHVGRPHPSDLDWNVLFGLVGYSRVGERRMLKLGWFWELALSPAARAANPFSVAAGGRPDLFF